MDALKETLNTDFGTNGPDIIASEEEEIRKVPTNETPNSNFHAVQGQPNAYQNYQPSKASGNKSPTPV